MSSFACGTQTLPCSCTKRTGICIEYVENCTVERQKMHCNFHTLHAGQHLSFFFFFCFQSLLQHEKPFKNSQYNYSIFFIKIHHRLSAKGKCWAAPVSTMGATYACPQVTYIFLCFPQPSGRNLFEIVETRGGFYQASYVTLGELGAISMLGNSQCSWAWCLGLSPSQAREVCLAEEGTVPALGVTVTSQGAPWHTGTSTFTCTWFLQRWTCQVLEHPSCPNCSCCGGE